MLPRSMLVCALAICGCGIFEDSDVLPSRIIYAGDTANIQIPATVTQGTPFEVVIETFGGGCFSDVPAATIVDVKPNGVTVSPFDLLEGDDACDDDLRFIRHVASVTVDAVGPVVFRFIGREGPEPDRPAELQRTVNSVAR